MGKAKDLYLFRGELVSAYQIAKAYGRQEDYWMIRRRLMEGMDAEEAVRTARSAKKVSNFAGIRPWELDQLRRRIKSGDKLRVTVRYVDAHRMDSDLRRLEKCTVTGVYRNLVTLRRPCGMGESKTYVDLILEGIR